MLVTECNASPLAVPANMGSSATSSLRYCPAEMHWHADARQCGKGQVARPGASTRSHDTPPRCGVCFAPELVQLLLPANAQAVLNARISRLHHLRRIFIAIHSRGCELPNSRFFNIRFSFEPMERVGVVLANSLPIRLSVLHLPFNNSMRRLNTYFLTPTPLSTPPVLLQYQKIIFH